MTVWLTRLALCGGLGDLCRRGGGIYLEGLSPSLRGGGAVEVAYYICYPPFDVDSPLLAIALGEVAPPSPCEGPPFAPNFYVLHDCCRLRDGEVGRAHV